jgi:hypothetical protein
MLQRRFLMRAGSVKPFSRRARSMQGNAQKNAKLPTTNTQASHLNSVLVGLVMVNAGIVVAGAFIFVPLWRLGSGATAPHF